MPPVQHISFLELSRGTLQKMSPAPRGFDDDERQCVLELITKADGATGLIEAGPAEHPRGD